MTEHVVASVHDHFAFPVEQVSAYVSPIQVPLKRGGTFEQGQFGDGAKPNFFLMYSLGNYRNHILFMSRAIPRPLLRWLAAQGCVAA